MAAAARFSFSPDAERELRRYLRDVAGALRAHRSVDAEEVERDIMSHIESELAGSPTPISGAHLRGVLERLGNPVQWVPAERPDVSTALIAQVGSGPEDWRLAYLTFALFVGAVLLGPPGSVLFVASVVVARATVALFDHEPQAIGARRWLVYPPLLVGYAVIALGIAVVVPAVIASAADPTVRSEARRWFPEPFWVALPLAVTFGAGAWWMLLGLVLARFRDAVRSVFWPFADWFDRRHGMRVACVGLAVAIVAMGLAAVVWGA